MTSVLSRPQWVNASFIITVAADGLAPFGARPSADMVLTTELNTFLTFF